MLGSLFFTVNHLQPAHTQMFAQALHHIHHRSCRMCVHATRNAQQVLLINTFKDVYNQSELCRGIIGCLPHSCVSNLKVLSYTNLWCKFQKQGTKVHFIFRVFPSPSLLGAAGIYYLLLVEVRYTYLHIYCTFINSWLCVWSNIQCL